MAIFLRVARSNAEAVEQQEYIVQVSRTGEDNTWEVASQWFPALELAEARAREILDEAALIAHRATITIVSSFSGDTSV